MPTFQDKDQYVDINNIKSEPSTLRKLINKILTVTLIIVLGFVGYFSYLVVSTSGEVFQDSENCENWFCNIQNGISSVPRFFMPNAPLKGESEGRTNFLIMGLDSPQNGLTDTIILVSYFHAEKKIVSLNIPRDFWVNYKKQEFKINELFSNAETTKPKSGANELSNFLSKEFDLPIHYWAYTNFDGIKKIVTEIGDLEINVENGFTDCEFPNKDYSGVIPCQNFKAGLQKMNGERSLIYARSRKGDNNEGSDFARSKRQSTVIQAILQKIKNQNLVDNITKLNGLFGVLGANFRTNINPAEIKTLSSLSKEIDLKANYLKVSWFVGNEILCDETRPNTGYYIFYCDGEIAGANSIPSTSAIKARKVVRNLLQEAQSEQLKDVQFLIIGNGSKQATKIFDSLENANPSKIFINNQYSSIPVTPSPERISVYLKDQSLESIVKSQLDNLDKKFDYAIISNPPTKFKLPNSTAKIIIIIE
jgi:LCP family protein required for cell wall assembly